MILGILIITLALFVFGFIAASVLGSQMVRDWTNQIRALDEHSGWKVEWAWWSGSRLIKLWGMGMGLAIAFVIGVNTVIYYMASTGFDNASVVQQVLEKMDFVVSGEYELDQKVEAQACAWFQTNKEEKYVEVVNAGNANDGGQRVYTRQRDEFLNAYFVEPKAAFKSEDPSGLMSIVVNERILKYPSCQTGAGALMMLWNAATRSEKYSESCNDLSRSTKPTGLKKCSKDISGEDEDFEKELEGFITHVKEALLPSVIDWGIIGLDYGVPSARQILKNMGDLGSPERNGNAQFALADENNFMVMEAQVNLLRESLNAYYRYKAIIWGPIQLILLMFFFGGCIALSERYRLTKMSSHGLQGFVRFRLSTIGKRRATEQAFERELVHEAGFPVDFSTFVLPMIGFIGTVIGIASALTDAKQVVASASSGPEAQIQAIELVTGQLGVAFDTTLIALLASAPLVFGAYLVKSIEMPLVRDAIQRWDLEHQQVEGD